jgi:hypothetical protein
VGSTIRAPIGDGWPTSFGRLSEIERNGELEINAGMPLIRSMADTTAADRHRRDQDLKSIARQLLRQSLSREDEAVRAIDSLGKTAIRAASEASERVDRGSDVGVSSGGVLRNLQTLAEAHACGAPRQRRFNLPWGARPAAPAPTDLNALVHSLEHEKDSVERTLIAIQTDKKRLDAAESALDEALALIHACNVAFEAAVRELSIDQPARAAFLREALLPRLAERERDVVTQIAVTRQGAMALQLVADGQAALGDAIERARSTSVAALRTAIAARRAVASNRDLLDQAQALENTAKAVRTAPQTDGAVEAALTDALEQARRAIHAAQVPPRAL